MRENTILRSNQNNKILYITDLDKTLLGDDQKVPKESITILNRLMENGLLFTYATARSIVSASKVTEGVHFTLPVITKNGVAIVDPQTRENILYIAFSSEMKERLRLIMTNFGIYPLVYAYVNGQEKCMWVRGKENAATKRYLDSPERNGDHRLMPVDEFNELFAYDIHYIIGMGEREDFVEAYAELQGKEECRCFCEKQLYDDTYWLEIMPKEATKANAMLRLKELLVCEKMVCFGDGVNDISMFQIADECYAVENAVDELKQIATDVIGSNEDNGVARWLSDCYR